MHRGARFQYILRPRSGRTFLPCSPSFLIIENNMLNGEYMHYLECTPYKKHIQSFVCLVQCRVLYFDLLLDAFENNFLKTCRVLVVSLANLIRKKRCAVFNKN